VDFRGKKYLVGSSTAFAFNSLHSAKDYIFAQLMGGLVGALLVYGNYYHAIDIYEGGAGVRTLATAGFFSTYAVCANCPSLNNHI
jgi:glycerol uptake facilitator-like aquaporin